MLVGAPVGSWASRIRASRVVSLARFTDMFMTPDSVCQRLFLSGVLVASSGFVNSQVVSRGS